VQPAFTSRDFGDFCLRIQRANELGTQEDGTLTWLGENVGSSTKLLRGLNAECRLLSASSDSDP
jgi:hypothetical protein